MNNKIKSLQIIKQIWGNDMHNDIVQFKLQIKEYLQMLIDTENEPNTYKRGCQVDYYNQILSNNIINSLTLAYQNGICFNELYQYSINENITLDSEETKEESQSKEYKYYYRLRPPSIGCQPRKGLIKMESEMITIDDYEYWGYVTYDRPLTENECYEYDLDYKEVI